MNETTVYAIDQLAFEWTKAKNAEMYANLSRIEIEKKILALFEPKEEGTVTPVPFWLRIRRFHGGSSFTSQLSFSGSNMRESSGLNASKQV